jgi:RNA polymerase sigma-70 factor (ECF subfamily)
VGQNSGADGGRGAIARGNALAEFNRLVLEHQRQVYNLCYRTLGNAEDAADVSQDAFLHAYRAYGGFRGSAEAARGWLLRIAANACIDTLRRRKRRPTQSLDEHGSAETESHASQVPDPAPGPEPVALGDETAAAVQRGLLTLSPEQRVSVVLCDVQGYSYEEAARTLHIELGTLKSRLSRGRATLREYLTARGELPAASRRLEQ